MSEFMIHYDVLSAIQDNYFNRIKHGEKLTDQELIDCIQVNNEMTFRVKQMIEDTTIQFSELREKYDQFKKMYDRRNKILRGFLRLHNLESDYANYFDRIERKLDE